MGEDSEERRANAPLRPGLERHVTPASNGHGVVTKTSSDDLFGPEGLGFAPTMWTSVISWLARSGISEQTGSNPGETTVEGCVAGWGQGAYSSHVFDKEAGVARERLAAVIQELQSIAEGRGDPRRRITGDVLAAFVNTQPEQPYSTVRGVERVRDLRSRLGARFRSHIQWQALYTLCGQISRDGEKLVTPEMLETFFTSEQPFFGELVARRRMLRRGELAPGEARGPLRESPDSIDRARTDRELARTKSGLWMIVRILAHMLSAGPKSRRPIR